MPRPGPRPYECVKRAWHSDRHRPMRGSIIQQIFRLVNETHSPTTRKNKEWQEKLPIVVLKAEEIMYSKANSEAEYMNVDTLWDRVNDAINTIIRRDETTETGELLPPCVEAALNLGCIPVRASRSQRHCNPRTYLSSRAQEPAPVPPRILDKTVEERCHQLSNLPSGNQLNYVGSATNVNPTLPVLKSNPHVTESSNPVAPRGYPFHYENIPPGHNQLMTMASNPPLNLGSVYPLYYGTHCRTGDNQLGARVPEHTNSSTIFVGKPVGTSMAEPAEMNVVRNFFSFSGSEIISDRSTLAQSKPQERRLGAECDLSLRLGQSSDPCMSMDKSAVREIGDGGPTSSQEGDQFNTLYPQRNKEFCFFPGKTVNGPFESSYSSTGFQGEDHNLDAADRKRKAPFNQNLEDGQFCWRQGLPSNQFIGQVRRPGS